MRPPDPDDPAFAAFVQRSATTIETAWRGEKVEMPPGVAIALCRAGFAYMRAYPLPKSGMFYDLSLTRLLPLVEALEAELAGGHTNPNFSPILEDRILDTMKKLRGGAT